MQIIYMPNAWINSIKQKYIPYSIAKGTKNVLKPENETEHTEGIHLNYLVCLNGKIKVVNLFTIWAYEPYTTSWLSFMNMFSAMVEFDKLRSKILASSNSSKILDS
jgi:hypothetical protein